MQRSAIRPERLRAATAIAAAALLAACTPRDEGNVEQPAVTPAGAIDATIDYARGDAVAAQIEELAGSLADGRSATELQLTILPEPGAEPNYRVLQSGGSVQGEQPVQCGADGGQPDGETFRFEFNPDYNHLLLTIRHDGPAGSRARCITLGEGDPPAFVIEGRYRVEVEEIPTAHDVTLIAEQP